MDIDLKRRQELFLDGIETSLEMANICYLRLRNTLTEYSEIEPKLRSLELHIRIILDAWSFVDIINRLRVFVTQVPGLKQNHLVKLFQKETMQVESLRDIAQHLDREAVIIENSGKPLWGTLSWIFQSPDMEKQKLVNVLILIPGRLAVSNGHPAVNPVGKSIIKPIDHISLTAGSITINLSKLYYETIQFKQRFSQAMEIAKGHMNRKGIMEITLL